jgi:hypothetical protein
MLKRVIVAFSVLMFLSVGAAAVSAQWIDLGSREVKDRSEQDTWRLGKGKGTFRKLKIVVSVRAVKFHHMVVTYGNGHTEDIEIRSEIPPGGESRAIELKGLYRYVDKVDLWYEAFTAGRERRPRVTLYGLR